MHVSKIVGPFGELAGWEDFSWNVQPSQPHVAGRIVFMTDGRAISYAESVMGHVADHKLGIIVGSTTAGTNGNIAAAALPGGYSMTFTGMRVTRHDGTSPFHLIGVRPDVPVVPTIAGLRAGKDEVLDRAVEVVSRQ
jgi:C-terminal processing protease CtpA/Prc